MALLDMLRRYALISHLLLACAIGHTSTVASGFYDFVTTFLSNKTCVAIFYNYAFMLFIFGCKVPVLIFLGQLSQLEAETLMESARNYLMDAILFLVLSKPRLNGKEVIMSELVKVLTFLVALKCFHIMLYTRLSHMFQVEMPGFIKLFRVSSLIYVLSILNCCLLNFFWKGLSRRNTFTIWILFEVFGMLSSLVFCLLKLVINIFDMYSDSGLVNKVTLLFYVELTQDIMSLLSFLIFMVLFFLNNPVNIPVYMLIDIIHVAKNLSVRLKMLLHYKRLSKILTTRFPAATKEEVEKELNCIICRDVLDETCRRIDCGHIFHLGCLKSWLFQHSSCPSCRSPIDNTDTGNYFNIHSYLVNFERKFVSFAKKLFSLLIGAREPRACKFAVEKSMKEIKEEIMHGYSVMCRVCIDYINSGAMDPETIHSDILWIRNNLRSIMNSLTATSESYARLLQDSQQNALLTSLETRMAALQDENLAPLLNTINVILRDVRRNTRSEREAATSPSNETDGMASNGTNAPGEGELETLVSTLEPTASSGQPTEGDANGEERIETSEIPKKDPREKRTHSMNLWLPKQLFKDSEERPSEQNDGQDGDHNGQPEEVMNGRLEGAQRTSMDDPTTAFKGQLGCEDGNTENLANSPENDHLHSNVYGETTHGELAEKSTGDYVKGSQEMENLLEKLDASFESLPMENSQDTQPNDHHTPVDKAVPPDNHYTLQLNTLVSHLLPTITWFGGYERGTERELVEEMRDIYQGMSLVWLIAVASLLQVTSKEIKEVILTHASARNVAHEITTSGAKRQPQEATANYVNAQETPKATKEDKTRAEDGGDREPVMRDGEGQQDGDHNEESREDVSMDKREGVKEEDGKAPSTDEQESGGFSGPFTAPDGDQDVATDRKWNLPREILDLLCGVDSKALLGDLHEHFQERSAFYAKIIGILKKSQLSQRLDLSQVLLLNMALSEKIQGVTFKLL